MCLFGGVGWRGCEIFMFGFSNLKINQSGFQFYVFFMQISMLYIDICTYAVTEQSHHHGVHVDMHMHVYIHADMYTYIIIMSVCLYVLV